MKLAEALLAVLSENTDAGVARLGPQLFLLWEQAQKGERWKASLRQAVVCSHQGCASYAISECTGCAAPRCLAHSLVNAESEVVLCPLCLFRLKNAPTSPHGVVYESACAVLQVRADACPEVIHAAYRKLLALQHPDRNKRADARAKRERVEAAFKVIESVATRDR